MSKMKIVLAYSGGLDTSIIIPWLLENYDCEVIAVAGDVGQGGELDPVREKALKSGASKVYIEDLRREFVNDFIFPTLKAGAVYEDKYLLGTSMARPVIAKRLVEIAEKENADAICHGCTGKGNDQVRFELTIKALNPSLKIIAPWRVWNIKSREEAIEYAEKKNIPVPVTKKRPYSMDRNIWHLSHEGGVLEDPWNEAPEDVLLLTRTPEAASRSPEYVEIEFEKGVPVTLNGKKLNGFAMLEKLNKIGNKHSIGVEDMVENRLVGMKSRGVYETPGGTILIEALKILESITLDKETLRMKQHLSLNFADLVYNGQWYTPLRESLSAFFDKALETTTGTVRLKLYKGRCYPAGVKSPYSLHDIDIATFSADDVYNQKDAEGFINLFGLPLKVRALKLKKTAHTDKKGKKHHAK
ncbi:MAG: argininosuccinate synthase [Clostridiales bacterium]|jgi:argininosuccinate synthase|nr:argininosuccinate synthase [Clostridiales bacterium]